MSTADSNSEFDSCEFSGSTLELHNFGDKRGSSVTGGGGGGGGGSAAGSVKNVKTSSASSVEKLLWNNSTNADMKKTYSKSDDSYSEVSDCENFLAKGAFLLTPSHDLTIDKAALICEKMSFKGSFR